MMTFPCSSMVTTQTLFPRHMCPGHSARHVQSHEHPNPKPIYLPTQALAEAQRQRAGATAALRALDNALARMRAERALTAGTTTALTAALAEAACRARAGPGLPTAGALRPAPAEPPQAVNQVQRASEGDPGAQAAGAHGAIGTRSAERGALAEPWAGTDEAAAVGPAAGAPAALQGSSSAGEPAQHAEPAPASACAPACTAPGCGQAAARQGELAGRAGHISGEGNGAARLAGPSIVEVADGGTDAPRQLRGVAEPAACSSEAVPEAGREPNAADGGGGSAARASATPSVGAHDAAAPRFLTLAELAAEPLSVPLGEPMQAPDQAPGPGKRGSHAASAGRAPLLLARGPCREPDQARTFDRPARQEAARMHSPSGRRLGKENVGGGMRGGGLRSSAELSALLAASRAHARCPARAGVC